MDNRWEDCEEDEGDEERWTLRCQALSPGRRQCELPHGHKGPHCVRDVSGLGPLRWDEEPVR